jgi:hypothetical protein
LESGIERMIERKFNDDLIFSIGEDASLILEKSLFSEIRRKRLFSLP